MHKEVYPILLILGLACINDTSFLSTFFLFGEEAKKLQKQATKNEVLKQPLPYIAAQF